MHTSCMADMSHPQPSNTEEKAPVGLPDEARSFADLGEGSMHLFIVPLCLLLISPIGNIAPLSVLMGLVIFAFATQLALRFPYVVMPDFFRGGLEKLSGTQRLLGLIERQTPSLLKFQRKNPHWLMLPPFDIFPRVLLATCGLVIMVASAVPSMTHVLGVAGLLMSVAILARNMGVFFLGAALLSWSSVLPLLTN